MRDFAVAFFLTFVIEGLYYAVFPEKAQKTMRDLLDMPPEMLRKAGLLLAVIGVLFVSVIRRYKGV